MTNKGFLKIHILFSVLVCVFFLAGCLTVSVDRKPQETEAPYDNLLNGGDFNDLSTNWGLYTESGGSASISVSKGQLKVDIKDPGKVGHAVQLYYDGFELLNNGKYRFSADVSSDVNRSIEWRVQINGGDYHRYAGLEDIQIGPEPVKIQYDFVMEEASDPSPRMCFNLGDEGMKQQLGEHTVYLDNVSLELADSTNAGEIKMSGELYDINLNQVGYRPSDEKRAVIRDREKGDVSFRIMDVSTNDTVFEGKIQDGLTGGSSGDSVCYADFSSVTSPGRYRMETERSGNSVEFEIGDSVYDDPLSGALKMFYMQRCGTKLTEQYAHDHAHDSCHTEEARFYGKDGTLEVSGGWHDAGDYGRYASPAAKAVADLLLAYENYPDVFDDDNDIPESGNGIPDILDEARYELEWLHKMQSGEGGVYHKVTGLNFDGVCRSDECTEELFVLPESKTATADFAGVMYMSARIYKDIDKEFAAKCKDSADRALDWYIAHIDERNYVNPSDVNTGEYADGNSADEYLWAICEGYKTTADKRFEKMFAEFDMTRVGSDGLGWADMCGYAYYAFLSADKPMNDTHGIRKRFTAWTDGLKDLALSGEAYGSTIREDYPWGSNMTIANNGMALLMAYKMTGDDDHRLAAKRQLDYLFGTNSVSYCFLTGFGTQSPSHPHHRPSQASGKCVPGMLVGGPDSYLEDPYAKAVLSGLPKARCYVDNEQSYSCNEVTIYWNSPLVYLLAGIR